MDIENSYFTKYHPVLIIGYGFEGADQYWLCQNSFGSQWGENGIIRVKMEPDGTDVYGIQDSFMTYFN